MKNKFMKSAINATLGITLSTASISIAQAEEQPKQWIENVKGDVYLFQDTDNEWNTPHGAIFIETENGIVVTDPINDHSVEWLEKEIQTRFNKPVTHMVYSHYHNGHNSDGQAWGDGIEIISHEATKRHIEAGLTHTAVPTMTFSENMTFTAGGKTFEAVHLGDQGHSDDLIALVVRPENVAFVVDLVTPNRLPLTDFPYTHIEGMIDQLKAVEALDFEIMVPGHGGPGTKADVTAQRQYIEELMVAVKTELQAGKSVEQITASVKMEKYQDWYLYNDWLSLNIQGMAKWLQENNKL